MDFDHILLIIIMIYIPYVHTLCSGQINYTTNYVVNGDFQTPALSTQFLILNNSIPGWTFFQGQIGKGTLYNPRWNTGQVIQLDVNKNQKYNQTMNLNAGEYFLEFQCAARNNKPLESSGFNAYWNNKLIINQTVVTDYLIHTFQFSVLANQGSNLLTLEGAGISTLIFANGQSCDNVKLYQISSSYNKQMINGVCACKVGFFDNGVDLACRPCNTYVSNCSNCSYTTNSSYFSCLQCQFGYLLVNQTCQLIPSVCSDKSIEGVQQCDDGNLLSGDGCSSSCQVEPNYECSNISQCFYIGTITLDIINIDKNNNSSQLTILLDIGPKDALFWNTVNFSAMVILSNTTFFDSYNVIRNADGTVTIVAIFNSSIDNMNLTIQVDPSLSGQQVLSRQTPISKNFIYIPPASPIPEDNQTVQTADKLISDLANIVRIMAYAIAGAYLLLFLVGVFSYKLIGVESMAVIQISCLSLMTLTDMNPVFEALTNMWFVNGISYFNLVPGYISNVNNVQAPQNISVLHLYLLFFEDYNLTSLLIIVPLLIGLVLFIVGKKFSQNKKQKQQKYILFAKRALCEFTLNGLMFSGYIIVVSFVLSINYSLDLLGTVIPTISFIIGVMCILLLVFYLFLIIKFPPQFGQFTYYFRAKDKQAQQETYLPKRSDSELEEVENNDNNNKYQLNKKFYSLLILQRIIIGGGLVSLRQTKYSSLFIIIIFVIIGIIIAIRRPYFNFGHNFRFFCNLSVCMTIQIIYLCYSLAAVEQKSQKVWLIMPLIVCILLVLCFVYNSVYLVHDIITRQNSRIQGYQQENRMEKIPNNTLVTENEFNQNQNNANEDFQPVNNNPIIKPQTLEQGNIKISQQRSHNQIKVQGDFLQKKYKKSDLWSYKKLSKINSQT